MSSLTINQEKQIRRLREHPKIMPVIAKGHYDTYVELAGYVREYRGLERKWGEKATARREVLLKEIDLCLAVLGET
jgi:hypothetical protein